MKFDYHSCSFSMERVEGGDGPLGLNLGRVNQPKIKKTLRVNFHFVAKTFILHILIIILLVTLMVTKSIRLLSFTAIITYQGKAIPILFVASRNFSEKNSDRTKKKSEVKI